MRIEGTPGFWLAVSVIGVAVVGGYIALSIVIGAEFAVPSLIAMSVTVAIVGKGPLGQALARRIESRPDPTTLDDGARAELDELRHRMLELEERVDFAERLLARQREPERLPNG
jgi:hypothetical protein